MLQITNEQTFENNRQAFEGIVKRIKKDSGDELL